ncbi:MAG: SpoIVB peptidase S55 domain-containing protein [Myxococcota bacterium]
MMNLILLFSLFFQIQQAPSHLPSKNIKPGMKGYGLTVFKNRKIEKFKVKVIAVIPNSLISQNLILVKLDHPVTNHAGVIGGMSGSPIYINGKFAGGLGYGFSFHKDPVAIITPAEAILKTMKKPVDNVDVWGRNRKNSSSSSNFFKRSTRRFYLAKNHKNSSIKPLTLPLSVGGIDQAHFKKFFPTLNSMGKFIPSGVKKNIKNTHKYQPGSPVGVVLVRGDMNAAAIGTVTHIKKNRMALFSHPFIGRGETRLPIAHATIHTVIARTSSSMKLGTITQPQGTLIQDEQATVVANKDKSPGFVPVIIKTSGLGGKTRTFNYKIVKHRLMTDSLINGVLRRSLYKFYQNYSDLTYSIQYKIYSDIIPKMTFTDTLSNDKGISLSFKASSWSRYSTRGQLAIQYLLDNPFKRAVVKKVEIKANITRGLNNYNLQEFKLPSPVLRAGRKIKILLKLKPEVGQEIVKTIPLEIPEGFESSKVYLQISSGRTTSLDKAKPQNIMQFFKYLRNTYDRNSLVITMKTLSPSVDIKGTRLKSLPLSIADSLLYRSGSEKIKTRQTLYRKVIRIPELISGSLKKQVFIKDKSTEN